MSTRVNHAIVEMLANAGLGYRAGISWMDWAIDAVHAAHALDPAGVTVPRMREEADDAETFASMALALLAAKAHTCADFGRWPDKGLRREAVGAILVGLSSRPLRMEMPQLTAQLNSLRSYLQVGDLPEEQQAERLLRCLLLVSLDVGLGYTDEEFWSGQQVQEQSVRNVVVSHLEAAKSVADVVALVEQLIPEHEPPAKPDDAPSGGSEPSDSCAGEGNSDSSQGGSQPEKEDGAAQQQSKSSRSSPSSDGDDDSEAQPGEKHGEMQVSDAEDQSACTAGSDGDEATSSPGGSDASAQSTEQPGQALPENGGAQPPGPQEEFCEIDIACAEPTGEQDDTESDLDGATAFFGELGTNDLCDTEPPKVEHSGACNSALEAKVLNALMVVLQNETLKGARSSCSGGRVNPSRLWRMQAIGDMKVFKTKPLKQGRSMAIQVLLDRSSSMEGERMKVAKEVAIATGAALSRMPGIKPALAVFPGYRESYATAVLPFGGNLRAARSSMQSLEASGGTPLGQALEAVRPGMLAQMADRRIAIVITDGKPSSRPVAEMALEEFKANGIEVCGIGIGVDIAGLIPWSVAISEVSHLPSALTKLFKDIVRTHFA
jgi:uncharacterized protein YegL